jgi:RHS repeat-associated protein
LTEIASKYEVRPNAGDSTVENIYNAEGYRIGKKVNGTLTTYVYEYDKVVLELDGSGNANRNVYGLNLLMRTVGKDSYCYMYNGHADVTVLINVATGKVDATYYYDAFGNILESTGNVDNNITYAGYQYDEETGLYYLNARMYDPKIARFLQEDTYTGTPDDLLSLNLYVYCANNPLVYYDPTGNNYIKIGPLYFGNPIEGFKALILSTEEEGKENFRLIYLYGEDNAYTRIVTDIGVGLAEVGDLFKDPVKQMNENNEILDSFLSNDLGLKDSKIYNTAKKFLKSDLKKLESGTIYCVNIIRDTALTGYFMVDNKRKDIDFASDTVGLLIDGSNFESWKNSAYDYLERKKMLLSIPGNIVKGAVNDAGTLVNPQNAKNFFFNADASLESMVEYQSAGINTAMWAVPIAKTAPKIKTRITTAFSAIGEKGIKGFASDIIKGFKLKVGKKGMNGNGRNIVGTDFNEIKPTQTEINPQKVQSYADKLKAGENVKPIEVVNVKGKGKYIVEGHHRYVTSQQTGIPVEVIETQGNGPIGMPDWSLTEWLDWDGFDWIYKK